jgi:hypothetical protein
MASFFFGRTKSRTTSDLVTKSRELIGKLNDGDKSDQALAGVLQEMKKTLQGTGGRHHVSRT